MKLDVYNVEGNSVGKQVELDNNVFGIEPNDHCIYLAVKQYRANQRQGTHKSKERNEIAGSRKKIKKQKGTGTARFGDIKNPIFRGGGRIFGPRPRNYGFKLNKKVKRLARNSALSYKAKEQKIMVIEDFTFDAPKTKNYEQILKNLKLDDQKTLLVVKEGDANVWLSARNLSKAQVQMTSSLNTYDVLNANTLILSESAIQDLLDK